MPEQWEQRIGQWVESHRQELIDDIVELVRIKSVSEAGGPPEAPFGEGCRKALAAALSMGERYGFAVDCFENMVGTVDMGAEGETIGFWGHLDVVPEGGDWDFEPYGGVVKDGVIIGRGAQDNKGQTLAALYVMRCARELGLPLSHNLRLYLGTNEECGMEDVERYLSVHEAPPFNIIPDSNYPVCFGEKGIITARLEGPRAFSGHILRLEGGSAPNVVPGSAMAELLFSDALAANLEPLPEGFDCERANGRIILRAAGRAGHTAFPQNSQNAVGMLTGLLGGCAALPEGDRELLAFLNLVNADYYGSGLGIACEDEDSGRLTCVGSVLSLEQGRPVLTVNIRYPVTGSPDELRSRMERVCELHGFAARYDRIDPSHLFPREHPAVKILTDCYNRAMGDDKKPFVLSGGTYARKVGRAISYGMGFGSDTPKYMEPYRELFRPGHGGAHGPDECAVIDLLCRSIILYLTGLMALRDVSFS